MIVVKSLSQSVNVVGDASQKVTVAGGVGPRGPGPTPEQIQEAVDIYMATHPVPGPTAEQVSAAVTAYLTANPVQAIAPTAEQVAAGVASYLELNPLPGPTQSQVSAGVASYLIANPVQAVPPTPEQVQNAVDEYLAANPVQPSTEQLTAAVAAFLDENPQQIQDAINYYFSGNAALRESDKGANNGVATLDASGGLVQRMKIAVGNDGIAIRDAEGLGNGKASSFIASIATVDSTSILVKTGVWQDELDYSMRVAGVCAGGGIDIIVWRYVVNNVPSYGFMNLGAVSADITFGKFADGYSGWAFRRTFGRTHLVVTEAVVSGESTTDNQVRGWSMIGAASNALLLSQVAPTAGLSQLSRWRSTSAVATGSFRFERGIGGGASLPALVVADTVTTGVPVTLQIENANVLAGSRALRVVSAGVTKLDIDAPTGKLIYPATSNAPTGSFTMTAAASMAVANTCVTAVSNILLTPASLNAGKINGSAQHLYISAKTAGTGFMVATADATAVALSGALFNYWIIN